MKGGQEGSAALRIAVVRPVTAYHLGSMLDREGAGERRCLAISRCPDAWVKIEKMKGRSCFQLSKADAVLLDLTRTPADTVREIVQRGVGREDRRIDGLPSFAETPPHRCETWLSDALIAWAAAARMDGLWWDGPLDRKRASAPYGWIFERLRWSATPLKRWPYDDCAPLKAEMIDWRGP